MQLQPIDMNLFKENPQIFFKQLDKEAESEFANWLSYFVFKYNLELSNLDSQSISKFGLFEKEPINVSETIKYIREELNER